MKLKNSNGILCEVDIKDLQYINSSDKKQIEEFVRQSGHKFSEFTSFTAKRNVIIISAVNKENEDPNVPKECNLMIYKNQVDGKFCGFSYQGIYADGLAEPTMYGDRLLRLSLAEEKQFPQIAALFKNAEQFFGLKDRDYQSSYENENKIMAEISKPDKEFFDKCFNEINRYAETKVIDDKHLIFETLTGTETEVIIGSLNGINFMNVNNEIYFDTETMLDDVMQTKDDKDIER